MSVRVHGVLAFSCQNPVKREIWSPVRRTSQTSFFVCTKPPCLSSKFTEYVGELIFEPTFHSREWVYIPYIYTFSFEFLGYFFFFFFMWPHIIFLVGLRFTKGVPTFLSLIQHFRWIAVRLAMKRVTSIIAPHQIVAVLVRLLFIDMTSGFRLHFLVMLVNGEHRIGIYACTSFIFHFERTKHSFIKSYSNKNPGRWRTIHQLRPYFFPYSSRRERKRGGTQPPLITCHSLRWRCLGL